MTRQTTASRLRRLAVVVTTAALSACGAQLAFASTWTVGLGSSSDGQAQSLQLAAPTGVASSCPSPLTAKTVKVTWTPVSHASYAVYSSTTSSTSGFVLAASGVSGGSWTSGTLSTGTYWFRVATVFSSSWTSAMSASTASRSIKTSSPYCS